MHALSASVLAESTVALTPAALTPALDAALSTLSWVLMAGSGLGLLLAGVRFANAAAHEEPAPRGVVSTGGYAIFGIVSGAVIHFALPSLLPPAEVASPSDTHTTAPSAPTPTTTSSPSAGGGPHVGLVLTWVGIAAAVLVLVTLTVWGLLQLRRVHERRRAQIAACDAQWSKASSILGEVDAAYTAFHTDLADRIFTRPLLDDVDEPLTAAFIDALHEAHTCAFDSRPRDDDLAARALSTAQAAQAAWSRASTHARHVGLGGDPVHRKKLTTARRLLDQALDPGITDEYRTTLMDRITTLITDTGATTIPPVRSLIDEAIHRSLSHRTPRQLEAPPPGEEPTDDGHH